MSCRKRGKPRQNEPELCASSFQRSGANDRLIRVMPFMQRLAANNKHTRPGKPSCEVLKRAVRPLAARSPAQAREGSRLEQGGEVRPTRTPRARCKAVVRGSSHVGMPVGEWARCSWAGACSQVAGADPANPSIERTVNSRLRRLSPAAHVER